MSSFGASLMLGAFAPVDDSDGSGMNLMDLKARKWSPACLQVHYILKIRCVCSLVYYFYQWRDLLLSVLEMSDVRMKIRWLKEKKSVYHPRGKSRPIYKSLSLSSDFKSLSLSSNLKSLTISLMSSTIYIKVMVKWQRWDEDTESERGGVHDEE